MKKNTIWKFNVIIIKEDFCIEMPYGAKILTLQWQIIDNLSTLNLWCIVNTEAEKEKRYFKFFATGQEISDNLDDFDYIATIQKEELVYHLFEKRRWR